MEIMEIIVKDLVSEWLDALEKDYPTIFEDDVNKYRIGSVMSEYFHVYFTPFTFQTELFVECGDPETYASPSFIEKARLIAQEYYRKHFTKMLEVVLDLYRVAQERDIVPESVIIPKWIVKDCNPRFGINEHFRSLPMLYPKLYGMGLSTHNKNTIRIESPQFGFLVEREFI